jgi:hypothetical protein
MKKFLILSLLSVSFFSCTENARVKSWGGTGDVILENKKLITMTWKEGNLWMLTRNLKSTDDLDIYNFEEKSSFGMIEGTYIIRETRK